MATATHSSRRMRDATTFTNPRVSARRDARLRAFERPFDEKVGASRDRVAREPSRRSSRRAATGIASHSFVPRGGMPPKPFVVDDAPYVVGSRVLVDALFDGETRAATVVARKGDGAGGRNVKYYVRYAGRDARRDDEWVTRDHVRGLVAESALLSDEATTTTGGRRETSSSGRARSAVTVAGGGRRERGGGGRSRGEGDADADDERGGLTPGVRGRKVTHVELGKFICDCWYESPFPEEYTDGGKLYVCDFCLKYHRKRKAYIAHKKTCEMRHPPGNEIYRHPPAPATDKQPARAQLRIWEVDGSTATTYCQNLCLIAKLFLHHKTLYYDVAAFHFYVLTEQDFNADGKPVYRTMGYFSKEKGQVETNLACILTLPGYQRRGLGTFLIEFSYALSKLEGRIGTPERPLSDLGFASYKAYWSRVLYDEIKGIVGEINVSELSKKTNVRVDDIVNTLQPHSSVRFYKDQGYLKITSEGMNDFKASQAKESRKKTLRVDPARLKWIPHAPSRMVEVAEKRRRTRLFQKDEDERTKKSRK